MTWGQGGCTSGSKGEIGMTLNDYRVIKSGDSLETVPVLMKGDIIRIYVDPDVPDGRFNGIELLEFVDARYDPNTRVLEVSQGWSEEPLSLTSTLTQITGSWQLLTNRTKVPVLEIVAGVGLLIVLLSRRSRRE